MNGGLRALLRLYFVQGTWNYERMLGVGMGYAADPLLADLARIDPERHRAAVVRSAEFFNSHPYLAGLALGASIRAEYDGVPGEQVTRLRTALCSPLGAIGDQVFWAGLLPALVGATIAAVALTGGWWPVLLLLAVWNGVRAYTGAWALRTGLATGMKVGAAINAAPLAPLAALAGAVAGFMVGFGATLAAGWLARPVGWRAVAGVVGVAVAGLAVTRLAGPRYAAPRFALAALVAAFLLRWVTG